MKKLMAVTLILWAGLTIPVHGQAHVRMWQPEVLKGLKAVRLEVERLKPEIELDGLFRDTLQTDMELKLRLAGIKVLTEEEAQAPLLYLNVDVLKCSFGYVYNIGLYLIESVNTVRKPMKTQATVLRVPEHLGIASRLSEVRDAAGDILEVFVNAWKDANSKP